MAELTIRRLHKRFGPVEVLRGIDLQVSTGEFAVLVVNNFSIAATSACSRCTHRKYRRASSSVGRHTI